MQFNTNLKKKKIFFNFDYKVRGYQFNLSSWWICCQHGQHWILLISKVLDSPHQARSFDNLFNIFVNWNYLINFCTNYFYIVYSLNFLLKILAYDSFMLMCNIIIILLVLFLFTCWNNFYDNVVVWKLFIIYIMVIIIACLPIIRSFIFFRQLNE